MRSKKLFILLIIFLLIDGGLLYYYFTQKINHLPPPQAHTQTRNEFIPNITIAEVQYDKSRLENNKEIAGKVTIKNDENASISNISIKTELFKSFPDKGSAEFINNELYNTLLSFKPLESKIIHISHKLPQYSNDGDYFFTITALNQTGLRISQRPASFTNIKGGNKFLEIDWQKSKIIDEGQEKDPIEGPRFQPKEKPQIILTVRNPQGFPIKVAPHFVIYPRAQIVGVKPVADYTDEQFTFAPDSEQTLTFTLPDFETPESYLLILNFVDSAHELMSGTATFRWVIEGEGGKILSVKTEKTEMFFGRINTAITAYVIGPPDGSGVKNAHLTIKLFSNDTKKNLLNTSSHVFTINAQAEKVTIPVIFASNLISGKTITIQAELTGPNQKDLFHSTGTVLSLVIDQTRQNRVMTIGLLLFIVSIILIVVLLLRKRRFSGNLPNTHYLLYLLVFISIAITAFHAQPVFADLQTNGSCVRAETSVTGKSCADPITYRQPVFDWQAYLNTNKANWGDGVTLTGFFTNGACNNGSATYDITVTNSYSGMISWGPVQKTAGSDGGQFFQNGTVQNPTPGNYSITVYQKAVIFTQSNCFPNCWSESYITVPISIKGKYFYCDTQDNYTCKDAGFYSSQVDCEATGRACYTDFDFCKTNCQETLLPDPPQITITPGEFQQCYNTCEPPGRNTNGNCNKIVCQSINEPAPLTCDQNTDCRPVQQPPLGFIKKCQDNTCTSVQQTTPDEVSSCSFDSQCGGPTTQTHLACAAHGDAAFCELTSGGGGNQCSPEGIACTTNGWDNWIVKSGFPSCGPSQQERWCPCNGPCCGIAPNTFGCQADQDGLFGSCNSKQSRAACFNQAPQQTPSNITITQPLNSENPLYDGENVILSRDVRVTWKFNEGPAGCGNSASWGYNCTGSYDNKFIVEIKNPSGGIVFSGTKASIGGNGNKSYFITTTNKGVTTDGTYTVKICPENGAVQGTCVNGQFTKVAIPTKQVSGNIYEHFNADPFCAVGINNAIDLELKPTFSVNYLSSSCTFTTAPGQQGIPIIKTNFDCAIKYNNINYDIPTKNGLTPDYLDQKFTLQMKNPPPSQFGLNNNYYCVTKSNNACQQNLPNNNFLCIDGTNPNSVIQYDFDQNDNPHISQGEPATLVSIIFDRINTGANASNYYKLKNVQYRRLGGDGIFSPIPANPLLFDAEDNGGFYFLTGQQGSPNSSPFDQPTTTLGSGTSNRPRNTGAADLSFKRWESNNYSGPAALPFTPANLLELIKSRKKYTALATPPADYKDSSTNIYIVNTASDLTIADNQINQNKIIIINFTQPSKTLTLMPSGKKFNTISQSILIATNGTLKFDPSMDEANGIFMGQIVDLGDNTAEPPPLLPLKIKGNLISVEPINTNPLKRTRTDNQKPSLFVVFDAKPYMYLLPYLSTTNYTWNELVP